MLTTRNAARALTLAAALLFCIGSAFAQSGKIENIAQQASSVTEFEINGLKVLVKRRPAAPTVAVGLFLRGGARNLTEKTSGIENLMLNTAIEGGKRFPRQVLRRELSRTGGSLAASTGQDYSAVSLASTRGNFDQLWNVFTDAVLEPAFAPEDVERIKQQIVSGIREAETSPDSALETLQERVIYAGHPYANDVTGTIASIESFTPQDLRAYHQRAIATAKLLLVVVGDLDPNDIKTKVAASFGKLPRGEYTEKALPPFDFSKPTLDIVPRTLQTNYVEGIYNAPSLSSQDYYPMRVAVTLLQEMVVQEVRVRRQLSYAPNADLENDAANIGNIYVTAVDANQAVRVMLDQIESLKTTPVSPEKIAGMAGQYLTNYYLRQETNAAQAADLARYELIGGGWRNSFEYFNKIREVKPSDVQAVVNKYMKNLRFVVIGNPSAINRAVFVPAA
jgi:predicted Zn-dependent peptidase